MLVGGGGAGGTTIVFLFFGVGLGAAVCACVSETSAVARPAMIKMAFARRRGWGRSFFIWHILVQLSKPVNGNFEKNIPISPTYWVVCDGCALNEVFLLEEGGDLSCLNSDALFFEDMHPIVIEYLVYLATRNVA